MEDNGENVVCETPTPGKQPTRIDRWKYDLVRKAILRAVPKRGGGVEFRELSLLVKARLSAEDLENLGSVSWYVTTVKLDLEVRNQIRRVDGVKPQRLLRA